MKRGKFINNLYQTFTLTEFKREFKLKTIPLILLGFIVNTVCWAFTSLLDWPIWLDTLGTMIASFVGGPLVGAVTGLITSILWFWFEPTSIIFSPVHMIIGFIPGYAIMWYWVREKPKLDFLGLPLLISIITVFFSTILRVLFCIELTVCYTLIEGVVTFFVGLFTELGKVYFTYRFAREVVDKTIVVLLAWFFIRAPRVIRQRRWWWGRKRSRY
jgi:energy-coupling factor transport system substrate-specific component